MEAFGEYIRDTKIFGLGALNVPFNEKKEPRAFRNNRKIIVVILAVVYIEHEQLLVRGGEVARGWWWL